MFVDLGSFASLRDMEWVQRGLALLPPEDARLLARRWGLAGRPPQSIAELARQEGIPPIAMARRLQEAERRLLRMLGAAQRPRSATGSPAPRRANPGRGTAGSSAGSA